MILYWHDTEGILQSLGVIPSDESLREDEIMGSHILTLIFDLPYYVEVPVGAWCDFEGQRYELLTPQRFAKNGNRKWAYSLTMEAPSSLLKRWKVRNPADGSVEFPYTATPIQHIELLVQVLNAHTREGGIQWRVGTCLEAAEKLINYNHTQINDALSELASLFKTEWEVEAEKLGGITYNTLHLCKVEHFKDDPIPLAYGREGGFLPGIKRENSDEPMVERLYVQGTEENISSAHYKPLGGEVGSRRLLLPLAQELGFDGEFYSNESNYNQLNGKIFRTSEDGQSITLANNAETIGYEDSLDCTDIVPAKEIVVLGVETEVATNSEGKSYNEYNLILGISKNEDYRTYQVDGEVAYVVFQSGKLAGREFDIHTFSDGVLDIEQVSGNSGFVGWRFKLVGEEQDGFFMPSEVWTPQIGDKVEILGIQLPQDAICDNATKSGASWDMFREAIRVMWERSAQSTYYEGEISTSWVARNWDTLGAKVRVGGYVRFTDPAFEKEGALIRITAVKTYINNSHAPQITLSNEVVGQGMKTTIEKIKGEEVTVKRVKKSAMDFSKRRFRDTKEAQNMLAETLSGEFTETISPVAVNTMQAIFGATSLQYTFVESLDDMTPTTFTPTLHANETIELPSAYIKHETLGIDEVKPERIYSEYQRWAVKGTTLAFEDKDKAYYLYIVCDQESSLATFKLSTTPIELNAEELYYHFLLATIGKSIDGERSYQAWNGFTEITPGAIRANRFVSNDGLQYIDFDKKEFRVGNANAWVQYTNGELEVSGALIGDSVLGREIKVLDHNGQVAAGLSGVENMPLIYGAMQRKLWHQWQDNKGTIYYTLLAPTSITSGTTGIKLYEEPDERLEMAVTAQYITDGVIGFGSTTLTSTGKVVINSNTVSKARYQLMPSGVQMIGTPDGRRIEIQPNQDSANIVVYDEQGIARATISDAEYSSIAELTPITTSVTIGAFGGNSLVVGQNATNEYSIGFTASQVGTIVIPALQILHKFNSSGYNDKQKSVETQLWCFIDGKAVRFIEKYDNIDAFGISTHSVTTTPFSVGVTQGKHTLTFRLIRNYLYSPESAVISTCVVTAQSVAQVVYSEYRASLFTNGFSIVNSSNEMFTVLKAQSGMLLRAQVNAYGIEIDDNGLYVRIGGNWYSLGVQNGQIVANIKQ